MIIEVDGLSKSFTYHKKELGLKSSIQNLFRREMQTKHAVSDISFSIEEGEVVGFLGPNGAGKTTTLKMLSGILHPTSGSAKVFGYTPWERKNEFKRQFSIVMGQKNQLWWDLPANESLFLNKCIYEVDDVEYARTLGELTELLDVKELLKVQVRRLSLGERMKMELIAALIHKPRILLLDEPTIGLDIISQRKIREFFKYYNRDKKTTIVLTSHYMNDIEEMCDRSIIINHGRIVFDGGLNEVNERLGHKKIMKLVLSEPVEEWVLNQVGEVKEFKDTHVKFVFEQSEIKKMSRWVLDHLPVIDFTIEDIPIEEGIALLYQSGGEKHETA
ncbi:ABC-2 type transport system ATP-binding protein [Paenibacillus algorifonticola]|uniref:ABC-2 type transport system ATP-binding protein n=1 Tax=Paenibacillus algorifonticola TaxID=684063 RepID=A0A1I2IGE5_9BACL|nr:ABC transporter ATP-binding protein [Paenibacillus algorifonticola]SFF39621.1 ABC-2 type transport system ATP-binding protein [Paenibacillus algorifonticola]